MIKEALALTETAGKVLKENSNILNTLFPALESKRLSLEIYRKDILESNLSNEAKAIALATSHTDLKHKLNQSKIAKLAVDNAKEGTDFSFSSGVDIAFLDKFMNEAKFVYDDELQLMWAKVLAGEFEAPNSTSFNVIRILSEITKQQAEVFANICSLEVAIILETNSGFVPQIGKNVLIHYDSDSSLLKGLKINFMSLQDLESLGLIKFDTTVGYVMRYDSKTVKKSI